LYKVNTRKENKADSDKTYDMAGSGDQTMLPMLASIMSDLQEIKESVQNTVKVCDLKSMVKGLLKNYEEEAEKRETQMKTEIDRLTTDVVKLTMENETLKEKLCKS
jgi:ribosomal protein S20